MVDQILEHEPKRKIRILKNISGNELAFLGHFKDVTVMPGNLILETMIQGALLLYARDRTAPPFSWRHTKVRFLHPVLPGDQMKVDVEVKPAQKGEFAFEGKALVEDRLMAKGSLLFTADKRASK